MDKIKAGTGMTTFGFYSRELDIKNSCFSSKLFPSLHKTVILCREYLDF